MTETNTWRHPWMEAVVADAGCKPDDPRAISLSHAIGARALLRSFVFQSHKGVKLMELFAAKEDDLGFAFLPSDFYTALAANNYVLTDKIKEKAGPQWNLLKRLTRLFTGDRRLEKPVTVPRPLGVSGLVEYKPRLMFKGDGTLAHPDRFNRDDFAVLPFQLSEQKYAVGYYVVTHNMVHEWNPGKSRLDPARYTMPDQDFDLTLTNLRGLEASVSSYDPLTDKSVSVKVVKATKTSLTVRAPTTDTPRFLIISESKPGVLISSPRLRQMPGNKMAVNFLSSIPCQAFVSYGILPGRTSERTIPVKMSNKGLMTVPLPKLTADQGVKITHLSSMA